MPKARITKRTVDAMRPAAVNTFLWDTELRGFGVKCTPAGRRVYVVQYRTVGGRRGVTKRLTLGEHGALAPEYARTLARGVLAEVAGGGDPAAERAEQKRAPTVAELAPSYLDEVRAKKKPTTAYEYARLVTGAVVPALGRLRVADVSRRDVAKLHRAWAERPVAANRLLQLLGAFFAWCERQGYREEGANPARGVEHYRETARERYLSAEELARLGRALMIAERDGLPPALKHRKHPKSEQTAKHRPKSADTPKRANPFGVAAIRFLALSGFREQEALSLRWDAIDVGRGIVTLEQSKTGRSIRTLGAPALELLDDLPRLEGSPYVFPGAKSGAPLKEIKRLWESVREAAQLTDVRLHDLRHSFASVAVSGGASLPLVGALLGHRVFTTTQRYAHLADDPRKRVADETASTIAAALRRSDTPSRDTEVVPLRTPA